MKTRRTVQWRALWTLIFAAMFMMILVIRLIVIQVANASRLQAYARNIHVHKIILPAPRGNVIDRNGAILAMDVPTYQVVAAPKYVAHPAQESVILANYLPFSRSLLQKVLSNNTWYALLDRSVSMSVAQKIEKLNLTGISVLPTSGQKYPNGTLASQVIGRMILWTWIFRA